MTRLLLFPLVFIPVALASIPVRDACNEDGVILADVQSGDPVQVRHAVVGETKPCYSIVLTQAGKEVQGFILGSALPVIQEFERTRALESRIAVPLVPGAAPGDKKAPLPPIGPAFEPWNGVDIKGRRMQIAPADAKVTLVTFWSVESGAARHWVENLRKTEGEFRPRGLRSFGLMEGGTAIRASYFLEDMGLDCPQAFDRQGLAAKYSVDPRKGTTLVVDASNNVVAISSNSAEIRAVVARLLSSE
jgi:hypothetical protein